MTAPLPARTDHTPQSPVRGAVISGLIGGVPGAVMSAGANYLIIGLPDSASANAVNHAVSGLISGFVAGFMGLLMYQRKVAAARRTATDEGAAGAIPAAEAPATHSPAAESPVPETSGAETSGAEK